METEQEQIRSLSEIIADYEDGIIFPHYIDAMWNIDFPNTTYFALLDGISKSEVAFNKILIMCHETGTSAVKNIIKAYPEFFPDRLTVNDILAIDHLFYLIVFESDRNEVPALPLIRKYENFGEEIGYCSVYVYISEYKTTFETEYGSLKDNGIDLEKFVYGSGINAHYKTRLLEYIVSDFSFDTDDQFYDNKLDEMDYDEIPEDIYSTLLEDYFAPEFFEYSYLKFKENRLGFKDDFKNTSCSWNLSKIAHRHTKLLANFKFANDVLGTPPLMTYYSMFAYDIEGQLSEKEQNWINTFFDYYYLKVCKGYEKKIVRLNDEKSGIEEAYIYIKQHPTKTRYHFSTKTTIDPIFKNSETND